MANEIVSYHVNDMPLTQKMYEAAYDKGISFTQLLEQLEDPADKDEDLDAFERQLKRFNIRLKADPNAGTPASRGELFFQSNHPESRILFPEVLNRMARQAVMEDTDIISSLVSSTQLIGDSGIVRALYIDDTEANRQFKRVAERGEFPKVKISWSEKTTTLQKYGVCIQMSYEFVRRATLDIIQILIGRIMLQTRIDECYEAIQALLLGDGSGHASGGAITSGNASTYTDAACTTIADLTYQGYLLWLQTFWPGKCTTILAYPDTVIGLLMMPKPTVDPLWIFNQLNPDAIGGRPTLINSRLSGGTSLLIHPDVTANWLIGIDNRYALIAYREAGSDLTETDKVINGQWNEIVMSNTVGFQTVFASARKKLVCTA